MLHRDPVKIDIFKSVLKFTAIDSNYNAKTQLTTATEHSIFEILKTSKGSRRNDKSKGSSSRRNRKRLELTDYFEDS